MSQLIYELTTFEIGILNNSFKEENNPFFNLDILELKYNLFIFIKKNYNNYYWMFNNYVCCDIDEVIELIKDNQEIKNKVINNQKLVFECIII